METSIQDWAREKGLFLLEDFVLENSIFRAINQRIYFSLLEAYAKGKEDEQTRILNIADKFYGEWSEIKRQILSDGEGK